MAITFAMRTEVSRLYVALFGRAPDSEGFMFWLLQRDSDQSVTQIADAMFATAPARAYFPALMANQEIIQSFYQSVLGRTADAEGLAFWTGKLDAAGATPGSVINEIITTVANYNGTDPLGVASAALFSNKVKVAQYYAEDAGGIDRVKTILAGVTADPATVDAAIAEIDAGTIAVVPDLPQSTNGVATRWTTMTESTTNDGPYTINLETSTVACAADDTVQLMGVADIGYEKGITDYTFFL
jgi:S-layer protein